MNPGQSGVERFSLADIEAACTDRWNFLHLTDVNGIAVSLSVIEGSYYRHHHVSDDEFILVLKGQMTVHLADGPVFLGPGEGLKIPAGVDHLSVASQPTVALNVKGNQGETV